MRIVTLVIGVLIIFFALFMVVAAIVYSQRLSNEQCNHYFSHYVYTSKRVAVYMDSCISLDYLVARK